MDGPRERDDGSARYIMAADETLELLGREADVLRVPGDSVGEACTGALAEEVASDLPFETELRAGVTSLPEGILLVRGLANDVERLREMMINCWLRLRPLVHGLPAQRLRLWAT